MARMNIYVPDHLKRRMDETKGQNWSSVACQSFEWKLAQIITTKGAKDMKDVIARLKASKQVAENDDHKAGFETGLEWAKNSALAPELERLDAMIRSRDFDWEVFIDESEWRSTYSAHQRFVFAIQPETDGERQLADDFWCQLGGSDPSKPGYLRGFSEGALSIWDEVKDQL